MHDLGPGVRPGCADWLFLADELEPHPRIAPLPFARRQVAQLAARARRRERDRQKLPALAPDKASLHFQNESRALQLIRPKRHNFLFSHGDKKFIALSLLDIVYGIHALLSGIRY